jgi:hypothetical protein
LPLRLQDTKKNRRNQKSNGQSWGQNFHLASQNRRFPGAFVSWWRETFVWVIGPLFFARCNQFDSMAFDDNVKSRSSFSYIATYIENSQGVIILVAKIQEKDL